MECLKYILSFFLFTICGVEVAAQKIFWEGVEYEVISEQPAVAKLSQFRRCMANVTVPDFVKSANKEYAVKGIGYDAFRYVDCMYTIDLADVEEIEDGYAQYYEDNGSTSYYGGFAYCTVLESVAFHKVQVVGDYAFRECHSLKEVVLDAVRRIGREAFGNCQSLGRVVLGRDLELLGEECFVLSDRIQTIQIGALTPPTCPDNAFTDHVFQTAELIVPVGKKSVYQSAEGWRNFRKITDTSATGVNAVGTGARLEVERVGNQIFLKGIPENTRVGIYDRTGRRMAHVLSSGGTLQFVLPEKQIYMVKIGTNVYKIFL